VSNIVNDLPIEPIPLDALFAEDGINPNMSMGFHPRELIEDAKIIFGINVMDQGAALIYGRELVDQCLAGELDAEDVHRTLFIALDFDENCDELERLLALVDVLKGSHCYDGSYYTA
jgi:hypothetical protein